MKHSAAGAARVKAAGGGVAVGSGGGGAAGPGSGRGGSSPAGTAGSGGGEDSAGAGVEGSDSVGAGSVAGASSGSFFSLRNRLNRKTIHPAETPRNFTLPFRPLRRLPDILVRRSHRLLALPRVTAVCALRRANG
jgi:hypothetical protein